MSNTSFLVKEFENAKRKLNFWNEHFLEANIKS